MKRYNAVILLFIALSTFIGNVFIAITIEQMKKKMSLEKRILIGITVGEIASEIKADGNITEEEKKYIGELSELNYKVVKVLMKIWLKEKVKSASDEEVSVAAEMVVTKMAGGKNENE